MIDVHFPAHARVVFKASGLYAFAALTALTLSVSAAALAQTTAPPPTPSASQAGGSAVQSGVLGEVTSIDVTSRQVTLKTDAGQTLQVMLDEKTLYRRVTPGEPSLSNAAKITLADIGVGDRVYVQGRVEADQTTLRTRQLIVMSKDAIAEKRERESEDWRKRGIVGVITSINPEKKEITLQRGSGAAAETIILTADKTKFHRYAPDSGKFSDARPSTFEELKVGDVLRARGERSADGTRFTTEELVFGSFHTVGGTLISLSPETGELKLSDIQTRQPLTVVVNKNSVLRRMKPDDAILFAPQAQSGSADPSRTPASKGIGGDFQEVLERQPVLALAELKAGDMILISSSKGSDPSRLTAITLVAGMDAVLKQFQGAPPRSGGPSVNTGLPIGIPLP